MPTPAAMCFTALVATFGPLWILWHCWHYDRWRCFIPSHGEWFRAVMCYMLLASVSFFVIYTWMDVHVLYSEDYVTLPGETIPVPWQLWTPAHQHTYRCSTWLLALGWAFLQGVHLEEFLYWGYLIQSIRTPGGPQSTWLRSAHFKAFVILFWCSLALLLGATNMETSNLEMQRSYLFMIGSSLSTVLALASIILCVIFPGFIDATRRVGATYEVVERLVFFSEMNEMRTVFRFAYAVAFLTLSADTMTSAMRVNKSPFWSDFLYLCGQMGIFCSTCISIVVLLPRNMTSESLPPQTDNTFHPMIPYKRPNAANAALPHRGFLELGERLNIDRGALAANLDAASQRESFNNDKRPGIELHRVEPGVEAPFASAADRKRQPRYSEFPNMPAVMQKLKSPFEAGGEWTGEAGPPHVFVTTSHTVHED